jgi:DNA-binding NarL/FixJ family response regulator
MNRKIRVIVADDNRSSRQTTTASLSHLPEMEVVAEAINGMQVVEMVASCHPDAVLMDLQMPIVDGFTATRKIKALWPEIRVIAMTVYSGLYEEAFAAGADGFLLKGCREEALQEEIMRFFAQKSSVPETHQSQGKTQ